MVKNSVKVFARLKLEPTTKKQKLQNYVIKSNESGFEDIIIRNEPSKEFSYYSSSKFPCYQFRYHQIFDQYSTQQDIFDVVAKPVVSSVINGFNGTIFAYGQTGSGKTYSITGCPKVYENRGIIPRCVQQIFDYLNQNPDVYNVHISYLEIYNEVGYDLLNPKQMASKLEEFPRVLLLEDGKGEAHLRNLTIHPVATEKDAMRLLFLGDTNRTIAETPMNEYSSRSHCIFTLYLNTLIEQDQKNIRSKLHIVDLAGSERIYKSNITGTTLSEAKNINLSLHYLEQVILALSTPKINHVPYRNSMLTYILKDSLCGNSLTTMLATLNITKTNFEETLSTCRFAKRVAMLRTDPVINEEYVDSHKEITVLQNIIENLKQRLVDYQKSDTTTSSDYFSDSSEQRLDDNCQKMYSKLARNYLFNDDCELNCSSVPHLKYCMQQMKQIFKENVSKQNESKVKHLERLIEDKNDEIHRLKNQLGQLTKIKSNIYEEHGNIYIPYGTNEKPTVTSSSSRLAILQINEYHKELQDFINKINEKYNEAKEYVDSLEICKQNIINIRSKLETENNEFTKKELCLNLLEEQNNYRKIILLLRDIEKTTNYLKFGMQQLQTKNSRKIAELEDHGFGESYPQINIDNIHLKKTNLNGLSNTRNFKHEDTTESVFSQNNDLKFQTFASKCNKIKHFSSVGEKEFINDMSHQTLHDTNYEELFNSIPSRPYSTEEYKKGFRELNDDETKFKMQGNILKENLFFEYSNEERNYNDSLIQLPNHKTCFGINNANLEVNLLDLSSTEKPNNEELFTTSNAVLPKKPIPSEKHDFKHFKEDDSQKFKDFMKTIPLTGDTEVDEEIFNFYRTKFQNK